MQFPSTEAPSEGIVGLAFQPGQPGSRGKAPASSKVRAGFLTTFFPSLLAFTEIPVCSLEEGLHIELCAETRGAGLAGVGAGPGRQ